MKKVIKLQQEQSYRAKDNERIVCVHRLFDDSVEIEIAMMESSLQLNKGGDSLPG